jgi:NifU-like protein involved in Fe-S cluster formation
MFSAKGCAISIASESLLTEMVKGKTLEEVQNITQKDLFAELGNIIQTRIKCAILGLHALKEGLRKWQENPDTQEVKGITL